MSKTELRRFIATLTKEQLAEVLMDVYTSRKEARAYLDYYINPNEKEALEKYRNVLIKEFLPEKGRAKRRVSVCRRAIKEFMTLQPSGSSTTNILLTYVEMLIIHFVRDIYEITETQKKEFSAQLEALSKTMLAEGTAIEFQHRLKSLIATAPYAGDDIEEIVKHFFSTDSQATPAEPIVTESAPIRRKRRRRFW
ncbi:MAG: DUF6155 family protein [Muribaculum sp.]|nr:DUF6155 family protein [Muribaculaceae bacterium]MCM1081279.1 DUF6155 family protein [Muribaculum sp.]